VNRFWVFGVKKNGEDRHWAGSGKVLVEATALADYLKTIGAKILDKSRCEVTDAIRQTDIKKLSELASASGKGWPVSPTELNLSPRNPSACFNVMRLRLSCHE